MLCNLANLRQRFIVIDYCLLARLRETITAETFIVGRQYYRDHAIQFAM